MTGRSEKKSLAEKNEYREQKKKERQERIQASVQRAGWRCRRCGADNMAIRTQCYRCSFRGPKQDPKLQGARKDEELVAESQAVLRRRQQKKGWRYFAAPRAGSAEGARSHSSAGYHRREGREEDWQYYGWQDRREWRSGRWTGEEEEEEEVEVEDEESRDQEDEDAWGDWSSYRWRSRRRLPRQGPRVVTGPRAVLSVAAPEPTARRSRLQVLWGWLCCRRRNREMHALHGNGPLALAEGRTSLWGQVVWICLSIATVRVGEEAALGATTVIHTAVEVVEDIGVLATEEISLTISWAGTLTRGLLVCFTWFLARVVWNKLVHTLAGNSTSQASPEKPKPRWFYLVRTAVGRASDHRCKLESRGPDWTTYSVESAIGKAAYRVTLHEAEESKCSCRRYVTQGAVCAHMHASAVAEWQHRSAEEEGPDRSFTPEFGYKPARRSGASTLALQEPGSLECFQGLGNLMSKARELAAAGVRTREAESRQARGRRPSARGSRLGVSPARIAAFAQRSARVSFAEPAEPSSPVRALEDVSDRHNGKITFLPDHKAHDRAIELLQGQPGGTVSMSAFSFDQPALVEELQKYEGRVKILADFSQTSGRTKLQFQSLKRLERAGVGVRLGKGSSVRDAYVNDGRGAVGGGLRGIQHGKVFVLVTKEGEAFGLVGSCNWSTSSRANREFGLEVQGTPQSQFIRDILEHLGEGFNAGVLLDAADKEPRRGRSHPREEDPAEA